MQKETSQSIHRESGSWELNGPAFVLHYKHVLEGVIYDSGCNTCRTGVEVIYKGDAKDQPGIDVPEGGGVDEEKAAASSRGPASWADLLGGGVREPGEIQ